MPILLHMQMNRLQALFGLVYATLLATKLLSGADVEATAAQLSPRSPGQEGYSVVCVTRQQQILLLGTVCF